MYWGAAPTKVWYDLYSIGDDGSDGRLKGTVAVSEYYGTPEKLDLMTRELVASLVGADASELTFITRAMEGSIEVWDGNIGFATHRLKRSARPYEEVAEWAPYVKPEKQCPQCGTPASKGTFIRGALVCAQHKFLFGGV